MTRHVCVELGRNGADSRPLLNTGLFAVELASQTSIAEFNTPDEARAAGERAPNRRAGSRLLVPGERKVAA